jgi:hypothetical protein
LPLPTSPIPNSCRCLPRQCSRTVLISHIHRGPSNFPNNNHSHLCWWHSRSRLGQWPCHSLPATPNPPQRNPIQAPKVAHAGQHTQIASCNVRHTYWNLPSCLHEQQATSLRGPCQIPRTTSGWKAHLAPRNKLLLYKTNLVLWHPTLGHSIHIQHWDTGTLSIEDPAHNRRRTLVCAKRSHPSRPLTNIR